MLCIFCWPWNTIWTAIAAIATVALFITAFTQFKSSVDIASAQFIANYNNAFYNPQTTELLTLFEFEFMKYYATNENVIENLPRDFSYFKVTMENFQRDSSSIPSYLKGKNDIFSCYEIENNLLNHFEDMGIQEEKGSLTLDIINQSFGFYINLINENKEIWDYIKSVREDYKDVSLFKKFENLANKIKVL